MFLTVPGEYAISVSAMLDPDPQISYAVAVTDFGAPSIFGFAFSQFIVPTAAPRVASHNHSSSTTDAGGGDGTPVTAEPLPAVIPDDRDGTPEIAVFTVSTNGGATFLNAGLDLSPTFVGASPSDTQGPFNPASIAGPGAGTYHLMRVDAHFKMAGNGDAYTFKWSRGNRPRARNAGFDRIGPGRCLTHLPINPLSATNVLPKTHQKTRPFHRALFFAIIIFDHTS